MRTLYAVSAGSYSDYGVLALFEKEATAKKWAALYNRTERYEEARVETFTYFEGDETPERVRFVIFNATVHEDGRVEEKEPLWKEEWTAGWYGKIPPEGRAVGRTWTAPAFGRGIAIQVSARTEELARKSLHDRIMQAKTMVPVPSGKKVDIE